MMETAITEGIRISVRTNYESNASRPRENFYFFSYHIEIENQSDQIVQLISRKWHIFDSIGKHHEVTGDGVIGNQPIIMPGESYQYDSSCYITSDMGKMWGHYIMERRNGKKIQVTIPEFQLMIPYKLN